MRTILAVVVVCCVGCLGNPVPDEPEQEQQKVYVYVSNYSARVDAYTTANADEVARWTVSGTLTQTVHSRYITLVQLSDIKTGIYNGPKDKFKEAEHVIPEEAKMLEQPFALRGSDGDEFTLLFKNNEPKWSINMKKGILHLLNIEYEIPMSFPNGTVEFYTPTQQTYLRNTLYGNCYITCNRTLGKTDEVKYEYTLDSSNCTRSPIDGNMFTNMKTSSIRDNLSFSHKKCVHGTRGNFSFSDKTLVANTRISYKSCPTCQYTQEVDQQQTLTLVNEYYLEEKPDVSEYTEEKDVIFEAEITKDLTSGRSKNKLTPSAVVERFITLYYDYHFNETFNYALPDIYNVRDEDFIKDMFTLLMYTDIKGIKAVENFIVDIDDDDDDIALFFLSLLSYVGTNDTTKYLINFLIENKDDRDHINMTCKLMLTIPRYVYHYSDDILIDYESLIRTENIVDNEIVNKAALFGFGTAIGLACKKNEISKKLKQQYIDMFNQKFLESEPYTERLNHLLVLINMGDCLDFDFITGITTNSSESNHLRLLALSGFKERLQNTNQDKLFSTYWPLVQKRSEPFEVRIAALDVLLHENLQTEQFLTIARKYSGELNEPEDRQIANYILSYTHSTNGQLEDFKHKNLNLRRYPKSFATGLYNFQYQDSDNNVGSYLKTQVITQPKNNIVNFVQFSFNSFAMNYDFGTYSVYINLHGICDELYLNKFFEKDTKPSLPELMKLLKEYNYNVGTLSKQGHIDIVVFVDNAAVYAKHLQEINLDVLKSLLVDLKDMLEPLKYVQFPVANMIQIPSDLGTLITLSTSVQNVAKFNEMKKFRNSWTHEIWMEVYNPILNTYISNFKYDNVELFAHLNLTLESKIPTKLSWYNCKDGLGLTWASNMGSAIDQAHCRECEPIYEAPTSVTNFTDLLGVRKAIHSMMGPTANYNIFADVIDFYLTSKHSINSVANPYLYPVLFIANFIHHKFGVENSLSSGSITIQPITTEDDVTKSTLLFGLSGNDRNGFDMSQHTDLRVEYQVENLKGELLKVLNTSTNIFRDSNLGEENEPKHAIRMISSYLIHKGMDNSSYFKICGFGERLFPNRTSDRLRLEQYEPVNSTMVFYVMENPEYSDVSCDDDDSQVSYTFILTEEYSPIDKEIILQNEESLKDYSQCEKDSKDLKFTAPTRECKRISNLLTEYGNYKLHIEGIEHTENENITTVYSELPVFEYSRKDADMIDVKFNPGLEQDESNVITKSVYYPGPLPNPLRMAYNMDDTAVSFNARSICTVTPTKIQQFSGKQIANNKKKWLAFSECFNSTRRGLQGRTIDDKHVGFTFYSNDKMVEGTVVDGKAQITYNGQPLNEYLYTDDLEFIVHFLDDDVIYVRDPTADAEFYYNTEYLAVRIDSLYSSMLCGVCN